MISRENFLICIYPIFMYYKYKLITKNVNTFCLVLESGDRNTFLGKYNRKLFEHIANRTSSQALTIFKCVY